MGARGERGKDGLTDLERRFAVEYLVDFNGTKAYQRASTKKVKDETASANAHKLLLKPVIQERVKAERDRLTASSDLSVKQVMDKLRDMLMWDARQLFDEEGKLIPIKDLDDVTVHAIAGIDVQEQVLFENEATGVVMKSRVSKYKLIDRGSILEKAMKYHGLFEKDNNQQSETLLKAMQGITFTVVRPK